MPRTPLPSHGPASVATLGPPATARSRRAVRGSAVLAAALVVGLLPAQAGDALTYVESDNGAVWQIHDAAAPGLDTGSIRTASQSALQGFGNLRVQVRTSPAPRLNGEMARGFGLTFDGTDTFETTTSLDLGGVLVTREVQVVDTEDRTRFFDTFTNTTEAPITVDVSFGGTIGYGTGAQAGATVTTASGDTTITADDAWSVVATASGSQRPVGLAIGEVDALGDQERDPFRTPMARTGHEANIHGYVNQLRLAPGQTRSLARYVLLGAANGWDAADDVVRSLEELTAAPDLSGLTSDAVCSLANWDLTAIDGVDADACPDTVTLDVPPAPAPPALTTTSPFDPIDLTIAELQAAMEAGETTSEEITQAYLDRIAAYDVGQWGFKAFITVADDALAQARAADEARADGATGELLGIPLAIKDLFDTFDMPTTHGTAALADWQPSQDAFQVAGLRAAGAVMIGKANMSQFAYSGSYSESNWGQVWNPLYPSKTSFGSSGGSAAAVAASLAAGAMGSQTGVSLYAPAVGQSLTTFRGTDGMASGTGIMPLTWFNDYGGPIARTVTDLAFLLNATTGTDPDDVLTAEADEHRPDDWTDHLDAGALRGKRIGYIPDSFTSSWATDGTGPATVLALSELRAAGASVVTMPSPPSGGRTPSGNRRAEGWGLYTDRNPDFPFADDFGALYRSELNLPYNRSGSAADRLTSEQVQAWIDYRTQYKERIADWMDEHGVDAVVYPGFLSDMFSNDSASAQGSSDRASGVLTSNVGLPTVVVPVGTNPNGYSIAMQLVGRAWDDAEVLGMGYALEQQADGQQRSAFAPPLEFVGDEPGDPDPVDPDPTDPDPADPSPVVACGQVAPLTFTDVAGGPHGANVGCVAGFGIALGTGDGTTFAPGQQVRRDQMASFLHRLLRVTGTALPEDAPDAWSDDDGSVHEAAIDDLTALGIVQGRAGGGFDPTGDVTRAQMASFLVRTLEVVLDEELAAPRSPFTDIAGSVHAPNVDVAYALEVAVGRTPTTFDPASAIRRDQMASFLARSLDVLDGREVELAPIG